jgi:hypothetical protein
VNGSRGDTVRVGGHGAIRGRRSGAASD